MFILRNGQCLNKRLKAACCNNIRTVLFDIIQHQKSESKIASRIFLLNNLQCLNKCLAFRAMSISSVGAMKRCFESECR
jgi:hypothetical protein